MKDRGSYGIDLFADGNTLYTQTGMVANSYKEIQAGTEFCKDTTLEPWSHFPSSSLDYMSDMQVWLGSSQSLFKNYAITITDDPNDYNSIGWGKSNNRFYIN